ncbi:hypothetical protein L6R53_20455 [Myxococcota bacterium]|nr:hypothetical protein [Myxococcota bacterium]
MREDFKTATKATLAKRAGYRCSFPGCGQLTVGPGDRSDESSGTGVAAHIYSAAPGGPRGRGGLSPDELRSAENGIWLCENHGRLVDNNEGRTYPASELLGYKMLHEAKVRREHAGYGSPFGWIAAVELTHAPVIATPARIDFGQATVFLGGEGSGKTAVTEWLMGMSDAAALWRWEASRLEYSVVFHTPEEHRVDIRAIPHGGTILFVDGKKTAVRPFKFEWLRNVRKDPRFDRPASVLGRLAEHLNVTTAELRNLFGAVGEHPWSTVTRLWTETATGENDEGELLSWEQLYCDVEGTKEGLPFEALSASEQSRVLLELLLAKGELVAAFAPTMVLVEWEETSLDRGWTRHYMERLAAHRMRYQLVVITRSYCDLEWANWTRVRFVGTLHDVKIEVE